MDGGPWALPFWAPRMGKGLCMETVPLRTNATAVMELPSAYFFFVFLV